MFSKTSLPTFQDWYAMKSWSATQATLLNVNDENGVQAEYEYYVQDRRHENNKVYVSAFRDNIGSYNHDMYNKLWQAKHQHRSITVWYDPNDPTYSVIDRDMRWGLITLMTGFCSVFILIGAAVAYAGIFSSKKSRSRSRPSLLELRKQWRQKQSDPKNSDSFLEFVKLQHAEWEQDNHPDTNAHWQERKGWESNEIKSGAKRSMIVMWLFATFWNAISSVPLFFAISKELAKGNYIVLIALLFPLVGLFLIRKAVQLSREWMRFGVIKLVLDPYPGAIGGHVGGHLHIRKLKEYQTLCKVELECVYSYVSGSGENRSRHENVKWAESGTAQVEPMSQGIKLSFRFDVPENLPEADVEQTGNYHFWRIKVTADIPGVDLDRSYNIPVYKTGEQSRYVRHDVSAQAEQDRAEKAMESKWALERGDLHQTALARALRYRNNGNEELFYFPMFREKGLTIIALIFAIAFGFATYSMNSEFGRGAFSIIFTVFSIPFALVALFAGVAAVYLPFNNLRVRINHDGVTTIRRLFIIPIKKNHLCQDQIKELSIKKTGSTGQGTKIIEHYKVFALTNAGNKVTIAESIDGKDLANQLKDFFQQRIRR